MDPGCAVDPDLMFVDSPGDPVRIAPGSIGSRLVGSGSMAASILSQSRPVSRFLNARRGQPDQR
jgi:hypothetical protein